MTLPERRSPKARSLLLALLEEAHALARGPVPPRFRRLREAWLGSGGPRPALPVLLFGWNLSAPVVFLAPSADPRHLDFAPRLLPGGQAADALEPYLCYSAERFERARRHGLLGAGAQDGHWRPVPVWNRAELVLGAWFEEEARLGRDALWVHRNPYPCGGSPGSAKVVEGHFQGLLDVVRPAIVVEVADGPASAWVVRQRQGTQSALASRFEDAYPAIGPFGDPAAREAAGAVLRRLRRVAPPEEPLYRPVAVWRPRSHEAEVGTGEDARAAVGGPLAAAGGGGAERPGAGPVPAPR